MPGLENKGGATAGPLWAVAHAVGDRPEMHDLQRCDGGAARAVLLCRRWAPRPSGRVSGARFELTPVVLIWGVVCQVGNVDFSHLRLVSRGCGRLGGWRSGRLCATRGQTDIRGFGLPQDHGSSWGAAV